ncbi:MAG: Fic family protein [Candidatus Pacebacteria bacterium]|nr:Fic family protein [Candidatus Paceibacterota bacterium]
MKFEKRFKNIPESIWLKINKIDEVKTKWVYEEKLSPQFLGRLKKSVLVTSTGASTRIEGAKLSDEDIEKMIRGISIQKFFNRDKQEAKGYFELLENVFNSYEDIQFNENTIKHFHKELLKYTEKDKNHRGDYKKQENKVYMVNNEGDSIGVLFDTTSAYLTPKEMQELVDYTKKAFNDNERHPLLIIANFIVEFLNIHPFVDGNGRVSRVLTNFLLLKKGYLYMPYVSHEKLIEDNKPEYYIALRKSQKTFNKGKDDIIPWLDFFINIVLEQSVRAISLLSEENIEKILSNKQLVFWNYLNSVKEASPKEISEMTNIARPTINQIANKLLKLKKIEKIGMGRSIRYRII